MWIVSLLFLVPGFLELIEPGAPYELAITWLAIGINLNPLFLISDKQRIVSVCILSTIFMLVVLLMRYASMQEQSLLWMTLLGCSGSLFAAYKGLLWTPKNRSPFN